MNPNNSWIVTTILVIALLFALVCSVQVADSEEFKDSAYNSSIVRWKILTKANYSSEIHRHPHLLLLITVPWCGESRSLMKELATAVANEQDQFGTLKLMLLYRNSERILASTLGASERMTVLYFHHSSSYRYGGRFRVQNILSSVRHVMSLGPKEHPLKPLNTPEELRNFLDSTDKAFVLLEFCGWASKLLARGLSIEANGTFLREKIKQKEMEYYQMSCKVSNWPGGLPWLSEFTLANDSFSPEAGATSARGGSACFLDDLRRFESFLPKFINLAREFFLPPEQIQFGLVSERALLSELNVEACDSWLMILHYAGCASCSKVLTEVDDLKIALQTREPVVRELGEHVNDLLPILPANKPSLLLFVDRSSDSLNVRKESKDALHAFRELALHHQILNKSCGENALQLSELFKTTYNAFGAPGEHRLSELLSASQKLTVKHKISAVMMNEGKQITVEKLFVDFQGSSLHDMVTNLFQKKELKLSSLAKDVGFQLLSEDFEIEGAEVLSSQPEKLSDQVLELVAGIKKDKANLYYEQKLQGAVASRSVHDKDYKSTDAVSFLQVNEKNPVSSAPSTKSTYSLKNEALGYAQDRKSGEEMLTGADRKTRLKYFSGSFFFCDGCFRLLKALTAGSRLPSVVIIDPIVLQHYVIPETNALNYSFLFDFLGKFLNGSLSPYQQSEPVVQNSREFPLPPFVNLDFHEADSIPRVTGDTFTELVLGNQFDYENSGNIWNKDVLVLFSNNWCGFCQRMELIVREVYRAIKNYTMMLKSGTGNGNFLSRNENTKSSLLKAPLIYLMDCTLNDCSLILKTVLKRELYPTLLLFPAVKKEAIAYEGGLAVSDIFNFLADHGILVQEKGILWPGVGQGRSCSNSSPRLQMSYHVLLEESKQNIAAMHNQIQNHSLAPQVNIGSILTATDKLLNAHPFDESKILIVKVDQAKGIEGLVVNKLINWESLEELEEGLELLKDAPLSFGGPVIRLGMPLVALSVKGIEDGHIEVLPGVYFLDQWATLKLIEEVRLGYKSVHGYWFFLGFSTWGWDQFLQEIAEGAWHVTEGNISLLDWPKVL